VECKDGREPARCGGVSRPGRKRAMRGEGWAESARSGEGIVLTGSMRESSVGDGTEASGDGSSMSIEPLDEAMSSSS
jgi:hypothetical protein